MSENKATKKTAAKKTAAKKAAKKTAAKKSTATKKTAKVKKVATASAKEIPTLAQLQEAAYFHFLERLRTGSAGDPGTDWAAAVAQFES
ncbi:MAG: hypothetical protein MUF31_12215 [Akkermansiaceae bacterium]|nr:hypothetical protein [Akkermansiaceae bacterium]